MSNARRAFWKEVRLRAWRGSREHFSWAYPVATAFVVFILVAFVKGWDKAMEDLFPTIVAAASAVIVAIAVYCVNVGRGASSLFVEQTQAIKKLEDGHATAIADLQAQLLASKQPQGFPNIQVELEGGFRGFEPQDHRLSFEQGGILFFLPEVRLINRENVDFVLELTLVTRRSENYLVEFNADKQTHPHVERVRREGGASIGDQIPGLVNVPSRRSVFGYVTFTVQKAHMELFRVTKEETKLWGYQLKVQDRVSGAEKLFPIPFMSPMPKRDERKAVVRGMLAFSILAGEGVLSGHDRKLMEAWGSDLQKLLARAFGVDEGYLFISQVSETRAGKDGGVMGSESWVSAKLPYLREVIAKLDEGTFVVRPDFNENDQELIRSSFLGRKHHRVDLE